MCRVEYFEVCNMVYMYNQVYTTAVDTHTYMYVGTTCTLWDRGSIHNPKQFGTHFRICMLLYWWSGVKRKGEKRPQNHQAYHHYTEEKQPPILLNCCCTSVILALTAAAELELLLWGGGVDGRRGLRVVEPSGPFSCSSKNSRTKYVADVLLLRTATTAV